MDDLVVLRGCEVFHCTPSEFEEQDVSALRLLHLKALMAPKAE
jgi:hypothetical protein